MSPDSSTSAVAAPRLAIFASGRGSNAEALMKAFSDGFIPGELGLVLTNRPSAPVIETAKSRGFATTVIPSKGIERQAHEALLLDALKEARIDHVLLAGYMRLLSASFLENFTGSVLNIHPALLPDFPGLEAAQRQWHAGAKVAGATVHFVDEGVDTGPVILQGSLVVRGDEGPDGLAGRILHEIEHVIYPRAVRLFLDRQSRATSASSSPAPN